MSHQRRHLSARLMAPTKRSIEAIDRDYRRATGRRIYTGRLGLVVIEGGGEVVEEGQDLPLPEGEAFEQIECRRLLESPALSGTPLRRRIGGEPEGEQFLVAGVEGAVFGVTQAVLPAQTRIGRLANLAINAQQTIEGVIAQADREGDHVLAAQGYTALGFELRRQGQVDASLNCFRTTLSVLETVDGLAMRLWARRELLRHEHSLNEG
jgi:hypothetical protein